jgi:hypothetical protein
MKMFRVRTENNNSIVIAAKSQLQARNIFERQYAKAMGRIKSVEPDQPIGMLDV